jgi:hypothetical protein
MTLGPSTVRPSLELEKAARMRGQNLITLPVMLSDSCSSACSVATTRNARWLTRGLGRPLPRAADRAASARAGHLLAGSVRDDGRPGALPGQQNMAIYSGLPARPCPVSACGMSA